MNEDDIQELGEKLKELGDRYPAVSKQMDNLQKSIKTSGGSLSKELDNMSKETGKATTELEDFIKSIDKIDKEIESTTNQYKKAQLEEEKQAIIKERNTEMSSRSIKKFASELAVTSSALAKDLINSAQDNGNAIDMSSAVFSAGISAAASSLNLFGTGLQTAGVALIAMAPIPQLKVFGGLLTLAGTAINFFTGAAEKIAQTALDVLIKQLEKTDRAFSDVTNAGAIFADGLGGMRKASVGAGLTLDQFSQVIKNNSEDLALSGMSVANAARLVGETGKIFAANNGEIKKQLLNLGYSFEEQAELTAEVMGNIRRTGQSVNPTLLATETQALAENMRMLAALTGDDVKAKTKQVRDQNQIAAFQQELLLQAGPKMAAQINTAMAGMTQIEQKAFRDRVIFNGSVITKEAAMYEATNRVAAEKGRLLYDQFLAGTFDTKAVTDANSKFSQAAINMFSENGAIFKAAYAGVGSLEALAEAGLDAYNQAIKFTVEAVNAAKDSVLKLKDTTDPLTENFQQAKIEAQQLAIKFEDLATGGLAHFASAASSVTTNLNTLADYLQGLASGGTTDTSGGGSSNGVMDFFNSIFNKVKDYRNSFDKVSSKQTPVSGYSASLQGSEALAFGPQGSQMAPVNLDSSSITAAINQQTAVTSEVLRAVQKTNNLTSQIAQNSY